MAAEGQNFTMHQGDDRDLIFTIKDSAGVAVNISGFSFKWRMEAGSSSVTKNSTTASEITVTDGAAGEVTVYLDPSDTLALAGDFHHELQSTAAGVVTTEAIGLATLLEGKIT